MIKVKCPHCDREIEVVDEIVLYNLKRINDSLYGCESCKKKFLIHYDGDIVKTLRISR